MKDGMKVSIITPTFNSEKTVENTIKSVISQKYKNIQYIIIDGGSSDKTIDIINKYRSQISEIITEPDKGIADAFNKGISLSSGAIIGIINSDDELLMDAISILVKEYDGASDVFCGSIIAKGKRGYQIQHPNRNIELLKERMCIPYPGTFISKSAYDKYGVYDLSYRVAMDRELLLRMYTQGATFQFSDTCFSLFNCGAGISTINPVINNFPEDEVISIKYGLDENRTKDITREKLKMLNGKKRISKVFDLLHLWPLVNLSTRASINKKEYDRIISLGKGI